MLSRAETSKNDLSPTPIKSSMSLIFENSQTWSNYMNGSQGTVASRRTHERPGSMTRSRGDFKEWSADFSDISGFRNMDKEMFDTFTERLVRKHSAKKKRMADRKTSFRTCRNDRKTKKSRQIFTLSRPTNLQQPGRSLNEGIEIYESGGGSFSYKRMEGTPQDSPQPPSTTSPTRDRPVHPEVVPLPRVVSVQKEIHPYDTDSSCDTQIFIPERLVTPKQLGTCFPRAKSQPHLYYSISDQSMPLKSYTSAHSFDGSIRKICLNHQDFMESEAANCQITSCKPDPVRGLSPMISEDEYIQYHSSGRSPETQPNGGQNISELKPPEDICFSYQELDDFLSKKMAKTLTGISILPTHGRLMSYAKFNSSFKITEEVYEDVNRRSINVVPTVGESLAAFSFKGPNPSGKNFDYIHKLNPDFDENQSLTEALTAIRSPYQSSSLTSVDLRSEIVTKAYGRFAKSVYIDEPGRREKFKWIQAPEAFLTQSQIALILEKKKQLEDELTPGSALSQLDQKSGFVDFSNESGSCVSLSRVVSAIRQQRLTEFKISLRNAQNLTQKETDLRSSTTLSPVRSDPMEITCGGRVSRKKLCDVISQTGVFNNSSIELFRRPFWRFKLSPVLDERRTKLVHDFVSKAHHYMCGKDYHRTTLNRCFFRRTPAIRLSDQSTQFPDSSSRKFDRLGEIEKPEDDDVLSVKTAMYCQIVHKNCHFVDQNDGERNSDHSLNGFKFGCSDTCRTQTEENPDDPSSRFSTCHKQVSRISFTEINCGVPSGNSTVYYHTESNRPPVQKLQGLVQPDAVYDSVQDDLLHQTSVPNQNADATVYQQPCTPVSHSFRALCDKRRIKIKYENGKYTVYKEVDHSRRQTMWSLLTGKATNILNIVLPKKPTQKRSSRSHKLCS